MSPADDDETLRFYAREAAAYAADGKGESRHLAAFLQRLRPGARILELGCGGGRDTLAMIARGFDVDAADGVAEMAREAEGRIGRRVRVLRFEELDAIADYDAVWAHASLLHVPRTALREVLISIWRALRPGGLHFANFKGGGAEGRDGLGRYYNYLTADEVAEIYGAYGRWDVVELTEYVAGGYDGRKGSWAAITVSKR